MKSVASEERRIQQQIVAQQKKELTSFLESQKKEYRLCKDKIKDVSIFTGYVCEVFRGICWAHLYTLHPSVLLQEMDEDLCSTKEEKQERLSRYKETVQRSQAEEEAHLLAQQRLVYDRSCRALKRRSLIRRHEFEQEQLREVIWYYTAFTETKETVIWL